MCGIVGYIGKREVTPILVNGLKRLEYRGYDSAGIIVIDKKGNGRLERQVGKVANLEKSLAEKKWGSASIGIAHTRWATHGVPSERNAHPQADCTNSFWVIHNGIVENYTELKESLIAEGHKFASETDTETLAHLVEKCYQLETDGNGRRLMNAVKAALKQVRGTYGMAVIAKSEPDKIIAARNSGPLIIGVGKNENMIASDAAAVISHTKDVIYLNDGEIAEVKADSYRVETIGTGSEESEEKHPAVHKIEWDAEKIEKGGHPHFMHKEIFEIPETIINSTRGRIILDEGLAKLGGIESVKEKLRGITNIKIVACGTASLVAKIGEYMLEEYAGIPVEVDTGSEFRYRKQVFEPNTLLIAISQSGETLDTLAAVREAQEKGVMTMGIVNAVGSTIARETGVGIYNHAGPEIAVASTKAVVSQLTVLALLTIFLGRQRQMSITTGKRIGEELLRLPKLVKQILDKESDIKELAKKYMNSKNFFAIGRKYNYPIAQEAVIKLNEVCYIPAVGLPAGELKHGPIALIQENFPTIAVAPKDSVYEKMISNIQEIRARKGPVIAITTEGNEDLKWITEDVIYIPKTLEMLTPLLSVIPIYLFTYHIATLKGNDVDKPRNLAKSVTVE